MCKRALLAISLVFFVGSLGCGLWKKETVVALDQVPSQVRASIEKETVGSTVKKIEKIESGGKVTYEVEYRKDGKDLEAYFAEDRKRVK